MNLKKRFKVVSAFLEQCEKDEKSTNNSESSPSNVLPRKKTTRFFEKKNG